MAFIQAYDRGMRRVIDAIDDVSRLVGTNSGIQIPKIAVVGDQSSGKSSLIESIFGISLPRGEDIVTRTPIQVEHRYSDGEAYAELSFRSSPDSEELIKKRIADLSTIDDEVREATRRVAGSGKGVVDSPIYLRVYTNKLPDLTVLDLPGITRNAVEGQPEDIEEIINTMIESHIAGETTVVLAIVQANVDFSTAAAIKLAKKFDPNRDRTMGVVTKIDLVESGSGMVEKLEGAGNNLKLKLGFIPVRNRTTQELEESTPLDAVRQNEAAFFKKHPQLSNLRKERRGIDALVAQLVQVQVQCIVKNLPNLKKKLWEKFESTKAEVEDMNGTVVGSESEAGMTLQQLLTQLQIDFLNLRKGVYEDLRPEDEALKVPRRVYEMSLEYRDEVESACNLPWFLGQECFDKLKEQSKDTRGVALPNFLSSSVFHTMFMHRVHGELAEPAMDLVVRLRQYIEEVLTALIDSTFEPFPHLREAVKDQMQGVLHKQELGTKEHVSLLIRQQSVIMTLNPIYMDYVNKLKTASTQLQEHASHGHQHGDWNEFNRLKNSLVMSYGQETFDFVEKMRPHASDNDEQALREMQLSLNAYSEVVLKRVYDDVPLGVRLLLVEDVGKKLAAWIQQGLQEQLADEAQAEAAAAAAGGDGAAASGATVAAGQGSSDVGSSLLALMQDPMKMQRLEELKRTVHSLEKAWATVRSIRV